MELKGGVGKTTNTVNLGVGLNKFYGKKVLLPDADPQSSLTIALGNRNPDALDKTLASAMNAIIEDRTFDETAGILHHGEGVDLLPSNIELSGMETGLFNVMSREYVPGNKKHVLLQSKILYCCDRFDMKSKKSLSGEKKYDLADTAFYFAANTDNRINYGPALENMVYVYARSRDYVQVAYTINESKATEDCEYAPLEMIRDNYPKYVATTDYLLQKRGGIRHIDLPEFLKNGEMF